MPSVLKLVVAVLLLSLAGCAKSGDGATSNLAPASAPSLVVAKPLPRILSAPEHALIIAAAQGDTETVRELLDKGVKVDIRDPGDGTPLGHAAWYGNFETAQLLIQRGADVNARKSDGSTVLMLAKIRKHDDIVDMLKKAGAK